jgi:hypothetical protein
MPKSVIYTAIFGGYDALCDPQRVSRDYDYICFTDDPNLKSNTWDIRVIDLPVPNDYPRSNRYIKINPHRFLSEYESSLYIDGNIALKNVLNIDKILDDYSIAIERHPCGECCIYKEAKQCKLLGFGIVSEIDKQIKDYRKVGFPARAGLWANGRILRKHNEPELVKLEEKWWDHIIKYSWRDQISFPVVFRGYSVKTLPPYYLLCQGMVQYKNHIGRKV